MSTAKRPDSTEPERDLLQEQLERDRLHQIQLAKEMSDKLERILERDEKQRNERMAARAKWQAGQG